MRQKALERLHNFGEELNHKTDIFWLQDLLVSYGDQDNIYWRERIDIRGTEHRAQKYLSIN